MPYIDLPDARLFYTEQGPSTGRPLLLLHASLQTCESMEPVRKLVDSAATHVVTPDQRGHGRSVNPGGSLFINRLADDMERLCEVTGLHQPVVVGYSLGGTVGIELARRGAASGLVVLASRINPAPRGRQAFDPDDIRTRSPQWAEQLAVKHVETPWEQLATAIGLMFERWPGFTPEQLAGIRCPVLVVQGDQDTMVPLAEGEAIAATVPGAQLHVVPRAGHPELLYRPDAMKVVGEWLAAH